MIVQPFIGFMAGVSKVFLVAKLVTNFLFKQQIETSFRRVLVCGLLTAIYQLPQVTQNEMSPEAVASLSAEFAKAELISSQLETVIVDAFGIVEDIPCGNVFANAYKILDHLYAFGSGPTFITQSTSFQIVELGGAVKLQAINNLGVVPAHGGPTSRSRGLTTCRFLISDALEFHNRGRLFRRYVVRRGHYVS